MKHRIYKRYKTRKKGGQHYHIGRKNYSSRFNEKDDFKRLLRFMESIDSEAKIIQPKPEYVWVAKDRGWVKQKASKKNYGSLQGDETKQDTNTNKEFLRKLSRNDMVITYLGAINPSSLVEHASTELSNWSKSRLKDKFGSDNIMEIIQSHDTDITSLAAETLEKLYSREDMVDFLEVDGALEKARKHAEERLE